MNGSKYWSCLVALFFLKTGAFGAKNWKEISVDAIFCFFFLDLFRKEEGKYTVTLINGSSLIPQRIQHKVVLLVVLTIFAGGF